MDSPSSLELFLLAAISDGCTTAYDLHTQAGLSVGSTQPALQRMVKKGWLEVETSGGRGRMRHALTGKGKKELSSWKRYVDRALKNQPGTVEDLFRLVAIAWARGDRSRARSLLDSAHPIPEEGHKIHFSSTVVGFYAWVVGLQSADRQRSRLRLSRAVSSQLRSR